MLLCFSTVSPIQKVYASIVFKDDFESNNFDAWTGVYVGNGNSLTTESINPYAGDYNAKAVRAGAGANAYCYKTLASSLPTAHARIYFKVPVLPTSGNKFVLVSLRQVTDTSDWIISGAIANDGGTMKWEMGYKAGGSYYYALYDAPSIEVDTYYCLELRIVVSTTVGEAIIYVDDAEIGSETGLDTGSTNIWRSDMGGSWLTENSIIYFDCCAINDSYIGLFVLPVDLGSIAFILSLIALAFAVIGINIKK